MDGAGDRHLGGVGHLVSIQSGDSSFDYTRHFVARSAQDARIFCIFYGEPKSKDDLSIFHGYEKVS